TDPADFQRHAQGEPGIPVPGAPQAGAPRVEPGPLALIRQQPSCEVLPADDQRPATARGARGCVALADRRRQSAAGSGLRSFVLSDLMYRLRVLLRRRTAEQELKD